jgi:ribosomal protein S18 acetylase RimI-like enzyme
LDRAVQHATIRVGESADLDALTRLINAAFVVEQVAIEGERVNRLKVEAFLRTGRFLLLEEGPVLQGCVYVEKRGDRGYLGMLAVEPRLQGRGIGRRLAQEAEQHLSALGCRFVDLRVISARSELASFYKKLGYEETGSSPMPAMTPLKVPCHFLHFSKSLARVGRGS